MGDSGVDDDDDNIAKGVGVVDGNDHGDIALAFDAVDGEDAVFEDDDYAMSALTPAAPRAAISSSALLPVVGGGGGDGGGGGGEGDEASIAIDPTTMTMTMTMTMTTEGAQHATGSSAADERATGGIPAEDGVVVAAQHSESDDRASSSSSSMTMPDAAAAAPAGGTNGMTGEVAGGGGGAASVVFATTATITCTEDDSVIESKDYDLLENNSNSNKLVRMLLRLPNNNDDVEREARREEKERVAANARKWSEWMVSGRKVWEGDDDTAESPSTPPTPSSSAFESSPPGSLSSSSSRLSLEGGDVGVSDGAGSDAAAATMSTTIITPTPSSTSNDITALDDSEKRPNDSAGASMAAVAGLSPPLDIVNGDRASSAASAGGASLQRKTTTKIGEALFRGIAVKSFAGRVKAMVIRRPPDDGGDYNKSKMMQTKVAASRVREPGRISASDWRANIINLPNSTILRDVRNPVAWVFVWATSWSIVYECLTRLVGYAAGGAFAPSTGGGVAGFWSLWAGAGAAAATPSEAGWIRLAAWASRRMCLPTLMHSMMVSAMSLLLVFRTNSAYQRFAEGRCACKSIFWIFCTY